mgnify:CR=1 FL=1
MGGLGVSKSELGTGADVIGGGGGGGGACSGILADAGKATDGNGGAAAMGGDILEVFL